MKCAPLCFISLFIFHFSLCQAQNTNYFDFSPGKVFIENKGQFKTPAGQTGSILYAYDEGASKIYFTAKGIIYSFAKVTVKK